MNLILILSTMLSKLKMTLSYAIWLSLPAYMIAHITGWYFENQSYVLWVLSAIAIDHLLGTAYHIWWAKDWSTKKNLLGFVLKVFLAVMVGLLFEGLNDLIVSEADFALFIKGWTILILRLFVFLYPAMSAMENSSKMTKGKFPPLGFFKRFGAFQKTGDLTKLGQKKDTSLNEEDIL